MLTFFVDKGAVNLGLAGAFGLFYAVRRSTKKLSNVVCRHTATSAMDFLQKLYVQEVLTIFRKQLKMTPNIKGFIPLVINTPFHL